MSNASSLPVGKTKSPDAAPLANPFASAQAMIILSGKTSKFAFGEKKRASLGLEPQHPNLIEQHGIPGEICMSGNLKNFCENNISENTFDFEKHIDILLESAFSWVL